MRGDRVIRAFGTIVIVLALTVAAGGAPAGQPAPLPALSLGQVGTFAGCLANVPQEGTTQTAVLACLRRAGVVGVPRAVANEVATCIRSGQGATTFKLIEACLTRAGLVNPIPQASPVALPSPSPPPASPIPSPLASPSRSASVPPPSIAPSRLPSPSPTITPTVATSAAPSALPSPLHTPAVLHRRPETVPLATDLVHSAASLFAGFLVGAASFGWALRRREEQRRARSIAVRLDVEGRKKLD